MDIRKRTDPLTLLGAVVSLFLVISNDPWWSIRGANGNNMLTIQVSPFYFHATATGLSTTAPFVEFLGPFTRILLIFAFVALGMSSLTPLPGGANSQSISASQLSSKSTSASSSSTTPRRPLSSE